jgi:hypothetical protein
MMIIISAIRHALSESRTLQPILGIDPVRWNNCRTEEGSFRNSLYRQLSKHSHGDEMKSLHHGIAQTRHEHCPVGL